MTRSIYVIDAAMAPATGDIRAAGPGDLIYVRHEATKRRDWPRYWDALGVAWSRGAVVELINREEI